MGEGYTAAADIAKLHQGIDLHRGRLRLVLIYELLQICRVGRSIHERYEPGGFWRHMGGCIEP
jgi:hypothetical protein